MQRTICKGVLLAGALMLTMSAGAQQDTSPNWLHITSTDVAATFSLEHAQVAEVGGNSFWLKGGSADAAVTFYRGLGIAANVTGEHALTIAPGVDLDKIAFMAGPRYTGRVARLHRAQIFGEWLFGGVHAFDSVFPGSSGTVSSAGAFSTQLGGGINIPLVKGLGIRILEVDYVHTSLPNNAENSQNDLRLAFGLSYHFGKQ